MSPFGASGTYQIDTIASPPTLTPPVGAPILGYVSSAGAAVFVFDDVTIGSGVTVRGAGQRPLALLSQSTFQLMAGGTIDVSSTASILGAGGGEAQISAGSGGASLFSDPDAGAGGGGFGGAGGAGGHNIAGTAGAGGAVYGNLLTLLQGGARGGEANELVQGGYGGGAVELGSTGAMTIAGTVTAAGAPGPAGSGASGGAGAGSGGGILLHGQSVALAGTLTVAGGKGGNSGSGEFCCGGGGGGGGRVGIVTASGEAGYSPEPTAVVTVSGGFGGTASGGSGFGQIGSPGNLAVGTRPGPPPAVVGCIEINGEALVGATVKFQQAKGGKQGVTTVTNASGCYTIDTATSGRSGTLTIQLPTFP